ncbi:MAG: GDSL-type esterase/lipase family protein, partial [Lentisphaeraceae bacterium]|nr:GDSL-type esterase/lipase family protein [Lentisphaeraceae bacterium]
MIKNLLLCFFLFPFLLSSQEVFFPKKNDKIVFAGDSITHQCMYTQYIENFLYTRYHDLNLSTFNAGISGDKAINLLDRFEEEVTFVNPKYVTVMLGMNDGRYQPFSQENFDTYKSDMTKIVEKIRALKATPVLIAPTMFDQQQYRIRNKEKDFRFKRLNAHPDYNAKLGMYTGWIRSKANDDKLNFINFWGPMNDVTAFARTTQPEFTLMEDSIHPNPIGQAIMAVQMAKYFKGTRDSISSVEIDVKNSAASKNTSKHEASSKSFACEVKPKFLPWVLPATEKPGPKPYFYNDNPTFGFNQAMKGLNFNKEIIRIIGLDAGSYSVSMNGKVVVDLVSHIDLAKGIDISQNKLSPTYQQALKLAMLNVKRNDEALRPYRGIQSRMKGQRRKFADQPEKVT